MAKPGEENNEKVKKEIESVRDEIEIQRAELERKRKQYQKLKEHEQEQEKKNRPIESKPDSKDQPKVTPSGKVNGLKQNGKPEPRVKALEPRTSPRAPRVKEKPGAIIRI